jgi:ATP-dependent DNA helicase HFM1/MER3
MLALHLKPLANYDVMIRLLPCAVEHLNAEIVQLTVSDITLAIEWLKCSYLYIRIKKA